MSIPPVQNSNHIAPRSLLSEFQAIPVEITSTQNLTASEETLSSLLSTLRTIRAGINLEEEDQESEARLNTQLILALHNAPIEVATHWRGFMTAHRPMRERLATYICIVEDLIQGISIAMPMPVLVLNRSAAMPSQIIRSMLNGVNQFPLTHQSRHRRIDQPARERSAPYTRIIQILKSTINTVAPSEDPRERQRASLARLTAIKESLTSIQFEVSPSLLHFDCDKALRPFSRHTSIERLTELLDYVNDESSNHDTLKTGLSKIQYYHDTGSRNGTDFVGPQVDAAKKSLSQLFNILNTKKTKVQQGRYNENTVKAEIRSTITSLIDAYDDCIDQVNAQLEPILLKAVVTELAVPNMDELTIFGAHALFQYRSNLLTEICYTQNRYHVHLADIERVIKNTLANTLNLGSRITTTGAHYDFGNDSTTINNARNGFLKAYNEKPSHGPDQRPITYLETGIQEALPSAPLEKLRTMLIQWVTKNLKLEIGSDGEYANEDIAAIVAAASEDPKNDFMMGGNLSLAGSKWLLESAKIIQHCQNHRFSVTE